MLQDLKRLAFVVLVLASTAFVLAVLFSNNLGGGR